MTASRDVKELMRYIQKNMPFGGGLAVGKDVSSDQYKQARHLMTDEKEITFHDARTTNGGLASWDFNKHGLVCISPPPAIKFEDTKEGSERIQKEYYPKLVELAKKVTGAKDCFLQSHLLREPNPRKIFQNPSRFAHSDASARSPPYFRKELVQRWGYTEEDARDCDICEANIWHPFEYPAYRNPLCLLDTSSVDRERDIAPIPYVDGTGEVAKVDVGGFELEGPAYNPNHRWVYISDQKPDEAWMFKQWDTRDGVAKQCYHNSFHDPCYDNDASKPGRKSMEFRLLLTWDKKAPSAKL